MRGTPSRRLTLHLPLVLSLSLAVCLFAPLLSYLPPTDFADPDWALGPESQIPLSATPGAFFPPVPLKSDALPAVHTLISLSWAHVCIIDLT